MRYRILSFIALLATAGACNDERHTGAMLAPAAPTQGSVAFLTVSNPRAPAGATVTVTAMVRSAAGITEVGAFTARLTFDAAGLTYLGESVAPAGMRALNAKDGEIAAAGASLEGFAGGRLFAVTFRVVDPAALESLSLQLSELAGVDFGSHLPKLDVKRSLFSTPAL